MDAQHSTATEINPSCSARKDLDDTIKKFNELADDPMKVLSEFTIQTGYLSQAQLQLVRDHLEAGDSAKAQAEAIKLLEDGYQDGVLVAWLYPFSSNYYRKFGFENGPLCCKYKLDLSFIPKYSVAGHSMLISRENSAEMLTDVKCIYERYASGLNGMIDNEKWEYRFVTEADPYAKQE